MFYFKSGEYLDERLGACTAGDCDLATALPCICSCSLDEVRRLVCHSSEREKLWLRLEAFLVRTRAGEIFSHLNLVGPFVSKTERPREIEAYLQTRASYGPDALASLAPLFELGLDTIYARYRLRVGFWVESAPRGLLFPNNCNPVGGLAVGAIRNEARTERIIRVQLER